MGARKGKEEGRRKVAGKLEEGRKTNSGQINIQFFYLFPIE
jgi:hypothetical protein